MEKWDVKSLVGDLDVAKGMTNATAGPHNAFIKEYYYAHVAIPE